jgi:hypothetical protein
MDDIVRETLRRQPAALDNGVESDLLGVSDAAVEVGERGALVEVGSVHDVPGRTELVGERPNSGGEALRVVEQQHLCRGQASSVARSPSARASAATRSPPSEVASADSCARTSASSRESRMRPGSDRWTTTFRPSSGSGSR